MAIEQDLEPLLSTQQEQVGFLIDVSNSIDSKALALLAINVAILIFIAQAMLHLHSWWESVFLIGPFILSLILNIIAIWPRKYASVGADLRRHPEYLTLPKDDLVRQLLSNTEAAILQNTHLNTLRLRVSIASIVLTGLGTLVLFAILEA
ncbi:MAG TPA: hypothetical protein VLH38_01065 [Patescibacteria group bacterium]|nr:hypothetical protein [Patescibacteria group bacterium]